MSNIPIFRPHSEFFTEALEELDRNSWDESHSYICTQYKDLDNLIWWFFLGDLTLICGRPGIGKTTLTLNLILNILKGGEPVGCFYLTESLKSFDLRCLSNGGGIDFGRLNKWTLYDEEWWQFNALLWGFNDSKLFISWWSSITLVDLLQWIETLCDTGNIRIVFIDGFRNILLSSTNDEINDITEISRSLRDLAKRRNISIVMTCQLSRAIDLRQGLARGISTPMLSDISDTGALEQDADLVLTLHNKNYYDPEEEQGILSIFVQKNRRWWKWTIDLTTDFSKQKFTNISMS